MQVRDDEQAEKEHDLRPEDHLERSAVLPLAGGERNAGERGDEQRAVAERPPAQAERFHRAPARLAGERADRGHADEDERRRAAEPDAGGKQVHGDEDGGHGARLRTSR